MSSCCATKKKKPNLLKVYWPLIAIVLLSVLASLALVKKLDLMQIMGFIFLFLSFLKLIDLKGFALGFSKYDPLSSLFTPFAYSYPFIELFLGLGLIGSYRLPYFYIFGGVILLITGGGIVNKKFVKKEEVSCACMGSKINVPLGAVSLVENLIMALCLIIFNLNIF